MVDAEVADHDSHEVDDLPRVSEKEESFFRPRICYPAVSAIGEQATGALAPINQQQAVELEALQWAAYWHEEGPYGVNPDWVERHVRLQMEGGHMLPAITVEDIRVAANSFPYGTACGADNVAPRAYARLPDEILEALASIYVTSEDQGRWPRKTTIVMIVMLPKDGGGWRPIGLFPAEVRVWFRTRAISVGRWERSHERACLYAGPGMGAQVAAWKAAFAAEAAGMQKKTFAQVLLDLVKAFEFIPHAAIISAAIKYDYPLKIL